MTVQGGIEQQEEQKTTAVTWEDLSKTRNRSASHDGSASPLIVVSSYTDFKNLAHGPKGTEAKVSLSVYRLNVDDGGLTLLSVLDGGENLAFARVHPEKKLMYACTETLLTNGVVKTFEIDHHVGKLKEIGSIDAQGTSTCYLTIGLEKKFMLLVNYWSSSVVSMALDPKTGGLGPVKSKFHPKGDDAKVSVIPGQHTLHNNNDENARRERQKDPHTHAVVLDPYLGCIAYVPDLGMDCIHELFFNRETGELTRLGEIKVGIAGVSHGPRYIEFHKSLPVCYVINEISSEVAVFKVNRSVIETIAANEGEIPAGASTLEPMQAISTIPAGWDSANNVCGRITVHPSGRFVLVSNRGHDSLAVFRIKDQQNGALSPVGWTHTRGATPRHFQFDSTGTWLIVANQDTNTIVVFQFNTCSGKLKYTDHVYSVNSPNFVACCPGLDD